MANPDFTHERLLEDTHDGIQEYDNPLPRWWVWIFWATIAFAFAYVFDFTGLIRGPGRVKDYEQQMADAAKRWPKTNGTVDAAALLAAAKDPAVLDAGKKLFASTCTPCHGVDGGGVIGPNLTDEYWIHGGTPPEIYHTINEGVLEKGMPQWGKVFTPAQIKSLTVYVLSLQGTHPAHPKDPQGTKVSP